MADPTKDELLAEAQDRGIDVPSDATKAQIQALLDAPAGAADGVVDGHLAASEVVDASDEEKPGPGSIMSKEVRPDERDLPAGTSAFQDVPNG